MSKAAAGVVSECTTPASRHCLTHIHHSARVEVVGELPVHVVYGDQERDLSLVIVQSDGPALLGWDWLAHIRLDWSYLACQSQSTFKLEELLQKYEEVFHE